MTPEQALTIIELALYRVSDRMKYAVPYNEDVVHALREVGEEIATIRAEHPRT
jgi:hypothetical protein